MRTPFKLSTILVFYLTQWLRRVNLRRRGIRINNSTVIKGHCKIAGNVEIGSNTIIQSAIIDGRGALLGIMS